MSKKIILYYWHINFEVLECLACHHHFDMMTVIADTEQNAFIEMKNRIHNEFDYEMQDIGEITITKSKVYGVQELKKEKYKWIEIYSVEHCIPDGTKTQVKATYNETEKVYQISRRAFLAACKRIGTVEYCARCKEKVFTQTGRKEGSQWYNLQTGIRPLTW